MPHYRPTLAALAAVTLATSLVTAANAAEPDRRVDEATLIAGERAWGQSFVTGDVATVERLLADDFIGVDTHGRRYDKRQVLDDVRAGPSLTSDAVDHIVFRFHGDTAVVQADEHEIGAAPAPKPYERVFIDTWVKTAGQWRIVAAVDTDPGR